MTEKEYEVIKLLMINPEYTLQFMANEIGVSRKNIAARIKKLKDKGIIERVGSDTKGYWKITSPNVFSNNKNEG